MRVISVPARGLLEPEGVGPRRHAVLVARVDGDDERARRLGVALEVEVDPHPVARARDRDPRRLGGLAALRDARRVEQDPGSVHCFLAPGPVGLGWCTPPGSRGAVSPQRPGQQRPAGRVVLEDLERQLRALALAVGEVVPGLGGVEAGLEVGRVRAARDEDERVALVRLDLVPRALLGVRVLRVDGEVGLVVVHPELDHLPVALVQAGAERERVVVVEVPEPVLQPQPPVGLDRAAVDAVLELGPRHAQLHVLAAVVALGVADVVALLDLAPVPVGLAGRGSRASAPAARAISSPPVRRSSWPGLSVHWAGLSAKYCSLES